MKILLPIHSVIKDPRQIAKICRNYLLALVETNVILMDLAEQAGKPVPPLYGSHIKFRGEPWAGEIDEFADCFMMLKRGWADCEDLCGYRCAFVRRLQRLQPPATRGARCSVKVYWRQKAGSDPDVPSWILHAQVRMPDGTIEDPSRRMAG